MSSPKPPSRSKILIAAILVTFITAFTDILQRHFARAFNELWVCFLLYWVMTLSYENALLKLGRRYFRKWAWHVNYFVPPSLRAPDDFTLKPEPGDTINL